MSDSDCSQLVDRIEQAGLIAVIRGQSAAQAVDICRALKDGGVRVLEVAMTTPNGIEAIRTAASEMGDECIVGVGTVLDAPTARAAIDAGADFVFAPNLNFEVIEAVKALGKPMVPGALTPTEIEAAWRAGADVVKVFPANHFGPRYLKDIHGPLPDIKLTPTGGVTLDNVKEWFDAGAVALGVGTAMTRKDLVKASDWKGLSDLAGRFVDAVRQARA